MNYFKQASFNVCTMNNLFNIFNFIKYFTVINIISTITASNNFNANVSHNTNYKIKHMLTL